MTSSAQNDMHMLHEMHELPLIIVRTDETTTARSLVA